MKPRRVMKEKKGDSVEESCPDYQGERN